MTAKAPEISKDELVELYSIASTVTRDLPGNIPGFLTAAYEAQFKARFPKKIAAVETDMSKSDLVATLEALKGFNPEAQASIDRACTVLTDGAALSMNIELKEGQGLPVALHTLLQGTVWAILMCGIADPDFTPSKLRHRAPARKRDQYTAKARHLWFMCKKFYFAHQMSEKDGWQSAKWPCSRLYSGRLFVKEGHVQLPEYAHSYFKYTRVRVPAVLAVEMSAKPMDWPVLVTSKGLYLWSIAHNEDEGRNEDLAPRLMEFRHCNSAVASFYDSLPVWHKNRIVVDLQVRKHALLCTPVGACFTLPGEPFFLTAHDMPPSFIPTKARMTRYVDVFSSETTHMITGYNERGELGFGQQLGYRQDPVRHYKKFPPAVRGICRRQPGAGLQRLCARRPGVLRGGRAPVPRARGATHRVPPLPPP
ncbi:hypothetical protein J8273_3499 [Carpediemonas membranifera]|uniref:Uncharacterized protein n=1 Tax=Carpediemonas membranifera TaxID=201153 RepID=A0A8J6B134_9EUKA|nr:hypothetical protein J8273_3499 [Carpediemonas membranifera]|eukprot:KAG9393363.1 hypothetical protein J8273_3499 [Carpediemonas membranifera]